jgi:hypothetical protein
MLLWLRIHANNKKSRTHKLEKEELLLWLQALVQLHSTHSLTRPLTRSVHFKYYEHYPISPLTHFLPHSPTLSLTHSLTMTSSSSGLPPFSLTAPRFDLSCFAGRLAFFCTITNPLTLFSSTHDITQSKKLMDLVGPLTHSHIHLLTHSHIHLLIHTSSLTHSSTLIYTHLHSLTHSLTHPLTHTRLIRTRHHSLTHSSIYPLTHNTTLLLQSLSLHQ